MAADASALASASGNAAISAALQDLSDSAAALGVAVCQSAEHQPAAQFTPSIDAVLLGSNATYTLTVTNQGSVATTYAVTTTLPTGPDYDSLSLDPGESQPVVYNFTPPALGFQVLEALVVATGPDVVGVVADEASAGLNVVNQFVQITSVTPDPPFVETGVSSTTVSIDVANVANLRREVTARTTVLNAGGGAAFTGDTPLTVQPGAPQSYALQTVNTSGWASGVYTVEVELLDALAGAGAGRLRLCALRRRPGAGREPQRQPGGRRAGRCDGDDGHHHRDSGGHDPAGAARPAAHGAAQCQRG